jgi:hypothetical protein
MLQSIERKQHNLDDMMIAAVTKGGDMSLCVVAHLRAAQDSSSHIPPRQRPLGRAALVFQIWPSNPLLPRVFARFRTRSTRMQTSRIHRVKPPLVCFTLVVLAARPIKRSLRAAIHSIIKMTEQRRCVAA